MLYNIIKRTLDILFSAIAVVLLLPIMLIVSIVIYLNNPGPIFYRQLRIGKDKVPFKLIKFRSMVINAPDLRNSDGSTFNSNDDPRVTKVGRFIRRTSIDELPQLFNVLVGDMSIVGPRPDPLDAIKFYREKDYKRLSVMQGITGWAQINGRNGIQWEKRRDLDLEYLNKKSIFLDLVIIFKTVIVVFKKHNVNNELR